MRSFCLFRRAGPADSGLARMVPLLVILGSLAGARAAPPRPAHDLWIEGESCADHDFTVIGRGAAFQPCYGSAILQLQTQGEAPQDGYHATFRPVLPTAGWWELRAAVTRTDLTHLSPFSVKVGDYRPRRTRDVPVDSPYGPGGIFAWLTVGCFELPAGEVPISFLCNERRASDQAYLLYVDALALRRVDPPPADRWWIAGPPGAAEWRLAGDATLAESPRQPLLVVLCASPCELQVNGAALGSATGIDPATALVVPPELLHPGHNAIEVRLRPATPDEGVLAWLSCAGEGETRRLLAATAATWVASGADGARGPVRVLGHGRMAPWGDLTIQPRRRVAVGRLPIPIKTGNLSVDLITAAVKGQPAPAPHASAGFDRYRDLAGISSVEDYICWLPLEPARDQFQWDYYERNCQELERRGMAYTVYPWLHFAPAWALQSELWEPLRCLEHDDTTFAPSIWSPATLTLFDRFYAALRGRLGDRVKGIYVSMICDYGEVGYPIGMADWVVPARHKHAGYWCGDARARQDFRDQALRRYGALDPLNAAWGTAFTASQEITYPPWTATEGPLWADLQTMTTEGRAQARRRWLDFLDWYLGAMVDFAGQAVAVSRRHYPSTPHEIKIGFGDERAMYGADYTAFVARSGTDGYTVRSTHGKLPLYFYRRFSSAAKHYGVPLVTEPPSGVSRDEEVERIFKEAVSGTTEYFDYPQNLLDATDLFARYGFLMEGQHSVTDVAFFFPTTDHRLRAGQHVPPRLKAACDAAVDRFDYDILDERLVRDGALGHTRVLLLVEGNVIERDVLERLGAWIRAGGILVVADVGTVETVEGDTTWEAQYLPAPAGLPAPEALWERRGKPVASARLDVGTAGDEALLTGDWHGPESGHWEWGGEPGAVAKRWTGARAGAWLAVDPRQEYDVAIAVALHPKRLSKACEVLLNGTRIGTVEAARTSVFRARVGPDVWDDRSAALLELLTEPWQPSSVDGSTDTRRLGVAVDWVTWRRAGAPEPAAASAPEVVGVLRPDVLAGCVRRLGRGAALRVPFGKADPIPFLTLAGELIWAPDRLLPGMAPGAPRLDGQADGVWTALLQRRVLLCNTGDHEVRRELALDPEALHRVGAEAPATPLALTLALPGHTLTAVELPSGRVLAP